MAEHFSDRLADAVDRCRSAVCVGLDPVVDRLPPEVVGADPVGRLERFCLGVIDAVAGLVPAVKPQSACFERFGAPGVAAMHNVIAHARSAGLLVVLDAKRGDIGVSAEHYAAAAFSGHAQADALTVNAYLGPDTVSPFLADPSRGVFILVRTSNPGSDSVQSHVLADGRTVAEMMADHVAALGAAHRGRRGLSNVGAVVGATKASAAGALRARMPDAVFLVPGYGAQGGTAADLLAMRRQSTRSEGDAGVLVNASRSLIYPPRQSGQAWQDAVRRATVEMNREISPQS